LLAILARLPAVSTCINEAGKRGGQFLVFALIVLIVQLDLVTNSDSVFYNGRIVDD